MPPATAPATIECHRADLRRSHVWCACATKERRASFFLAAGMISIGESDSTASRDDSSIAGSSSKSEDEKSFLVELRRLRDMGTFAGKSRGNALRRIRYIATKPPGKTTQVSNQPVGKREKSLQTDHSTEADRVLSEQRMSHERKARPPGAIPLIHGRGYQRIILKTDRGTFRIRAKRRMRLTPERMAKARVPAPEKNDAFVETRREDENVRRPPRVPCSRHSQRSWTSTAGSPRSRQTILRASRRRSS